MTTSAEDCIVHAALVGVARAEIQTERGPFAYDCPRGWAYAVPELDTYADPRCSRCAPSGARGAAGPMLARLIVIKRLGAGEQEVSARGR